MNEPTSGSASNGPEVTLSQFEVKQLLKILDLAARRGAFLADEFKEIGELYARLKSL